MIYSSLLFIYAFLPVSLLLFYITPKKQREKTLIILSSAFCILSNLFYFFFIILYAAINYSACRLIGMNRKNKVASAICFSAGIIFDLTAILIFRTRYFENFQSDIGIPKGFFPVGISFFTLSAIGTLIDSYKGKISVEKNMQRFFLYIMFFPKLILGPMPSFEAFCKALDNRREGLDEIGIGFTFFVKGLAKKVILADNLYMLYTAVHRTDVGEMSAITAWLGIIGFILSYYYTLSGFADMGIGLGYCFGIRLPQSFNYPLFSSKIKYFAARWQIQVVQWFRQYIIRTFSSFNRNRYLRRTIFVISWGILGFWYTFELNGTVWGILIGASILIENRLRKGKNTELTGAVTTFILTTVFSVLLAENSLKDSLRYLVAMLGGNRIFGDTLALYLTKSYAVIILIAMYVSTDLFRNLLLRSGRNKLRSAYAYFSPLFSLILLTISTILISYSGSSEMILVNL